MIAPPTTESELLTRAHAWAGRTLAMLSEEVGEPLARTTTRGKGRTGEWIERVLGADAGSRPIPDFVELQIELKTVPVTRTGKVLESTWVCSAHLEEIQEEHWLSSRVRHKLARVLFVPVEGDREIALAERRIGSAFLWSPAGDDEKTLRDDWEDFRELIAKGWIEAISARRGVALQMRPKAANAAVRRAATDAEGEPFQTAPRGFYLRRPFVQGVLREALAT